ncbi:MAG: pyruvate ferredoxin oxidoreductase [candidate division KSB1 bacterium]|nr:pyruvate ferredoxin oxidoreductase [candidate division KSB1 bacterium]MDZ7335612.1 pyruvate ferredoxin oxidoreductase [candidate division KSB1 bacterium]MDZ7357582.1 pyruvate ferredoxin oxidoreductase [candidate division KSB1 bacterium]MDZ7399760.1 pyruvate ferredoxin oxidoreductase [candidate division KSB1 bacterium]
MPTIMGLSGNEAVAHAMRQINPDVVAAYPITPQTELMHQFAEFHADGLVDTELVLTESEHSAMSATVGAAAAGARAMTATSANGLALMWEIVYIAASLRLPIVMPVINRALSGPINIHCDHSDTMGCRDSGWIQIFSENCQEAYDNALMAVKISEHKNILLPTMITLDGFILSHTLERVELLDDDVVKKFVGDYHPEHALLDVDHPITVGPLDLQDYYFEHKRQQIHAMTQVFPVIEQVAGEFAKLSGRRYGLIEEYRLDDAERAIILMGSSVGTAKDVVDDLRDAGEKVGLIKIRVYRPFPYDAIRAALKKLKAVAVLDRAVSFGTFGGPVYTDVRATLYGNGVNLPVINYIYGLGGRDIDKAQIKSAFDDLKNIVKSGRIGEELRFLGLRD